MAFFYQRMETLYTSEKQGLVLAALVVLLLLTAAAAMVSGAYHISLFNVVQVIWQHLDPFADAGPVNRLHDTIVWKIRLTRVLMAACVGAGLSCAGAVFQGCFRNPLVDPYILGVSSGAAFGAGLGIVFPAVFMSVQSFAFVFGVVAVLTTYLITDVHGATVILPRDIANRTERRP